MAATGWNNCLICATRFLEIPSLARLFQSPAHVQAPTRRKFEEVESYSFLFTKERDFGVSLILLRGGNEISS